MKLVVVTFGGRECSIKILFKYILKYKKYIDEYRIYIATTIQSDINFMENFAKNNSDFVKIIYTYDQNNNKILNDKNKIWDNSWKTCLDENTVYLRFDDDIVFIEESMFTDFINYRINNNEPLLIYPIIINNLISSYFLQENNAFNTSIKSNIGKTWINTYNRIKPYLLENIGKNIKIGNITDTHEVLCPVSWGNFDYCTNIHNTFIEDVNNLNIKKYKIGNYELSNAEPMSINCCSWLGSNMKKIVKKYGEIIDEEPRLAIYLPIWDNNPNKVYGNSIVSHYAYYRQRELGLDNTDILNKYDKLINIHL